MERIEPPHPTRVARSLRDFDGKLDPIGVAACDLICADGRVRPGIGLYYGEHLLLTARNWLLPHPLHLAEESGAAPVLFALTMVADYRIAVDGLTHGEVALTMPMLAALTGIKSRDTLLKKVHHLHRLGYIYHEASRDRLTPSFIRIFPLNVETGQPIFQAEESWLPGFVIGAQRGAPIRRVSAMKSRNFVIEPAKTPPTPAPEIAARIKMAPIVITNPPTFENTGRAADDEHLAALDVPGLHDLVRAHRDQLPPELDGLGRPDQESVQSIYQNGREIVFKFSPIDSAVDQNGPHGLSERGGIRHHDNYDYETMMIVGGASLNIGEAPLTGACGAASAPPPAAPPVASELFVAPLSQRLRQPGRWHAVLAAREPRLTHDERLALPPSQQACIEVFERFLGIPFCSGDLKALKVAMHCRGERFVKRQIEECARSIFAYDATREGMAVITKSLIAGWEALQVRNTARLSKRIRAKRRRVQPRARRQP